MLRNDEIAVSTTPTFEGGEIQAYLGVVSAHIVAGANFFRDFFASFSDVFGGRSKSYQKELTSINEEVIERLREEASALGANGIVGLTIDHDEISGSGKSMFMVTAIGTAVRISQEEFDRRSKQQSIPHEMSADDVAARMKRRRLVREIREKRPDWLMDKDWDFLIKHGVDDVSEEIKGLAEASLQQVMQGPQSDLRDHLKEYIAAIDEERALDIVYGLLLSENRHAVIFAQKLIKPLGMVDWGRLAAFLKSDHIDDRRAALVPLASHKIAYTADDIDQIAEIERILDRAFPDISTEVESERGVLSKKTKTEWECPCGKRNSLDADHCSSCKRDRRGLIKRDPDPMNVIAFLQECRRELEETFSVRHVD